MGRARRSTCPCCAFDTNMWQWFTAFLNRDSSVFVISVFLLIIFFFYLWNSSTSSAVPLAMPTPVTWQLHKYWCETDRNCWFIYLNIASTYSNNSEVVHHLNSFIPSFISPRDFSVLFGRKCVFYSLVPHTCTGNLFSFAGNRLIVKVLKVNEKIKKFKKKKFKNCHLAFQAYENFRGVSITEKIRVCINPSAV